MPSQTRADAPAARSPTVRACLLVTVALLPVCLGRKCGQAEIETKTIEGCTSFEHVRLLGHGQAVWLGEALHNHTDLEFLDLHHTKIGDDDAVAIAEGLKNNDKLRRLQMHNNRISDVGTKAIAEALKQNSALTFLSLSSNGVGDEGAAALGEMLKENHALRRLDLYFNLVGDAGVVAIAEGLKTNSALRTLHLDNNRLGDTGASALADMLGVNKGVAELTLMYNHVQNEGALKMVEAAAASTSLHTLELGHNRNVVDEAVESLKALKADHLVPRKELVMWLAEEGLTDTENHRHVPDPTHPSVASEKFDHHGPALHSPFAKAVQGLQAHTDDGIKALKALLMDDMQALHTHEATAHLTDEQRTKLVEIVQRKVANHDEL